MHSESERTSRPSSLHTQLSPEVLISLADKLQATAKALVALTHEFEPPCPDSSLSDNLNKMPEPDQIRHFLVPGFIVRQEKEILRQFRAESLVDFLKMARDDFSLTTMFMRSFHDDLEIDGPTVQHIGESLARPLAMLNKACSLFNDFELQMPTPRRPSDS
jgi:hypothetical protein